jgi:hypothetical protein
MNCDFWTRPVPPILLSSALALWGGFETALVVGLHAQNISILGSALFSNGSPVIVSDANASMQLDTAWAG